MTLIDVHAHNYYEGEEFLVDTKVIVVENGVESKSNQQCLELAEKYEKVKVALGWHPTHSYTEKEHLEAIEEINNIKANSDKIIAIGEIGLDFYHNKEDEAKKWQTETFKAYIDLAEELELPIIIHARNAVKEVLGILEEKENSGFNQKVIMHCMEASGKNIKIAKERGYFFTIPASVGRNEMFQRLVEMVPMSKMLTETDAPYQGPVKGEAAKPEDVKFAIDYIAKHNKVTEEEVENIIFMNYSKVF